MKSLPFFLLIVFISSCKTSQNIPLEVKIQKYQSPLISSLDADENVISFDKTGNILFFTRGTDWIKQLGYISTKKKGVFESPILLSELDTLYNGAISPSGKKILFSVRKPEKTEIWLAQKEKDKWGDAIQLNEKDELEGGYFNWFNEEEIYFYIPENEGDIVKASLIDNTLTNIEKIDALNTSKGTEFSPFISKDKSYILFTRYLEGDSSQQGIFVSYNSGTKRNPVWEEPHKIEILPYAWSSFVSKNGKEFYFSDGVDIFYCPIELLNLELKNGTH